MHSWGDREVKEKVHGSSFKQLFKILKYIEAPFGSLPSDSYFEYRSDKGSWA